MLERLGESFEFKQRDALRSEKIKSYSPTDSEKAPR